MGQSPGHTRSEIMIELTFDATRDGGWPLRGCSEVGQSCAKIRSPETRKPKEIRNPRAEIRSNRLPIAIRPADFELLSVLKVRSNSRSMLRPFGFRVSAFLRVSDFGLRISIPARALPGGWPLRSLTLWRRGQTARKPAKHTGCPPPPRLAGWGRNE